MYLLDAGAGRHRTLAGRARDAGNGLRGYAVEAWCSFTAAEGSQGRLAARVRAALGRYTAHPGAIEVAARGRQVTLTGDVLAAELTDVLEGVVSVRGVRAVVNRLIAHQQPDIPGLQGGGGVAGGRGASQPAIWIPSVRLAAGMLGAGLLVLAARRRAGKRRAS
jgi:hypothetical protein